MSIYKRDFDSSYNYWFFFWSKGIVISIIIQKYVAAIINSFYSGRLINYDTLSQLNDIKKYIIFFNISIDR